MGEQLKKNVKNTVVPTIHEIFMEIYTNKLPPDSFTLGIVTPVFKKAKQKTNTDNYRGITVTQITSKLMEIIMAPELNQTIDQQMQHS